MTPEQAKHIIALGDTDAGDKERLRELNKLDSDERLSVLTAMVLALREEQ